MTADALSPEQLAKMQRRAQDQLDGERMAGLAAWTGRAGGNQFIHSILNKDTPCGVFRKAFVQDPEGVQAGPVIEQLITEAIGEGFIGAVGRRKIFFSAPCSHKNDDHLSGQARDKLKGQNKMAVSQARLSLASLRIRTARRKACTRTKG